MLGTGKVRSRFLRQKAFCYLGCEGLTASGKLVGTFSGLAALITTIFFPFPISDLFTHVGSIRTDLNQRFVMHMSLKKKKHTNSCVVGRLAYVLPRQFEGHPG